MSENRSFELEIEVTGTPQEVWNAIATSRGVSAWLQPTKIEERDGGRFGFDLESRGNWIEGVVSAYDPPDRFVTTGVQWKRSDDPGDSSTLATEWIIQARAGGTCVVRVVMSGFDASSDWDDEVGGVRDGMIQALNALRDHLATSPVLRCTVGALIPVSDLERSVAFYRDALGMAGTPTPTGYRLRCPSGSALYLLPGTSYAGTAGWPLASFETADLNAFVADLQRREIPLLTDVPFPLGADGIHTGDGIRTVWFADPDGQVLTAFEVAA